MEFSHTYEIGKRQFFLPKYTKSFLTLGTHVEQCQIEEQPLLHQHDESVPLEPEVSEHEEVRSTEDIIKDKEISELKQAFSIAQSQITFLQHENFQLKVNQLLQRKLKLDMEENRGKGKNIIVVD